jgi:hypothetical protein
MDLSQLPLPQLSELASVALARALASPVVPLGPYTASGQIFTGQGRLVGYTVRATTATAAVVQLYDGDGTGGQMVADVDATQGSAHDGGPGDPGITIKSGLYLNVAAGAPSVVVWVAL